MIERERFIEIVRDTPLVSVDLVLVRGGAEILFGLRNNRPAQGSWFVPGGAIRKGEPRAAALQRVKIPLVVGGKKPGLEILYPVSTVILGGLVTSTFCEFLIHPGLFWKFSGKDAERLARTDAASDELAGARE